MKKLLALLLALAMVACLFAGCTGSTEPSEESKEPASSADESKATEPNSESSDPGQAVVSADDIPDTMDSADGKYEVAFVTDVGQLKDKSFNQGTYDGVKLFANAQGKSYKYYQPANGSEATDDDRFDAMKAAVEGGAQAVVCAGFLQAAALAKAAEAYPDVKFIFIDGWPLTTEDGTVLTNVAGINFQEEQCGYLAGYAAVKEGYTKLGFTGGGGGTNEACCRYGYGYVQGANAAAAELGINVEMKYTWLYGANFSPSAELQTLCAGWYEAGTEVIFSCGGSIFDSVTGAADAYDGAVIGVDVDQSFSSTTVITSALKGIGEAAQLALEAAYGVNGDWSTWGGTQTTLGAAQGSVGLPTATWSLKNWTVADYEALLKDIVDGKVAVDNDFSKLGENTPNVILTIVE